MLGAEITYVSKVINKKIVGGTLSRTLGLFVPLFSPWKLEIIVFPMGLVWNYACEAIIAAPGTQGSAR